MDDSESNLEYLINIVREHRMLLDAFDAHESIIARMQAELDSTRAWFADIQREFEKELAALRASLKISYEMADALSGGNENLRIERDALSAENDALCDALRKTQAELASAKLGIQ